MYYLIKGLEHKKLLYYFYSSLFVFYIILIRQDRTIVFFLILTIVILLLKRLSLKRVISFSLISGLLISFFIYYGNLIKHDSINQLNDLYYQTYLNLFSDDIPKENVDVRWQELETASKYIKKNPIWGSGELSKQWNNGFERLGHFYPADIGIFGFLFIYGIGGFLIACTQVFYFILLNRRTASKNNVFVATLKYSILLFYLNSFSDGSLMQRTAIGMTMIIILYYYSQQSIQVKNEKI